MIKDKRIIITGGTGYIGSHAVVSLIKDGFRPIVIDSLTNSDLSVKEKIEQITNHEIEFFQLDIRDKDQLIDIFNSYDIGSVMHFAGLKSVNESIEEPINYYSNNVNGTLSLIEAMKSCDIRNLVFSSSATVYGEPEYLPIDEEHSLNPTNPYGYTKLFIENILSDVCKVNKDWNIVCLRYFNPIGAHKSGLIGENPNGIPENLMPYILKVASGELDILNIFGNDYDTPDGTCLRDFIHIQDLIDAHISALKYLVKQNNNNFNIFNVGTGKSYSVLELVKTFEKVSNLKIKHEFVSRRKGDISCVFADTQLSENELEWKSTRSLESMCISSWDFIKKINY